MKKHPSCAWVRQLPWYSPVSPQHHGQHSASSQELPPDTANIMFGFDPVNKMAWKMERQKTRKQTKTPPKLYTNRIDPPSSLNPQDPMTAVWPDGTVWQ
eukprot:1405009-Alexandrium_andersonii.AAC.1